MFTIFICLRFRDSFTIQTTVIYLNSQIIADISALTFDRHPPVSRSQTLQIRPEVPWFKSKWPISSIFEPKCPLVYEIDKKVIMRLF